MSQRDLLLALAVPVLWGIAFTLAKPASEHFPPLLMFAGVYGCVAIVFSVLFAGRFRTPFWSGLVLGSLAGSIQAILIFMGLARLDAAVTVIVLGGLAMVLGIGQRGAAGEKPETSEPT